MANFSSAPDFPPGSQQWRRDIETALNIEQDTTTSIRGELAATAAASSTQVSVSAPDVVNAGILLGDPPTVYVDPYAYFTRNGYTFGGLNISWDYRGANGEILGGQANRYQVAVREVRVESDYPAFADMRVDPPPTGDSAIRAETESSYFVENRLDIQTTYATKVRSITATGTPGVWSDEVIVTTPKEPKVRPIDPPLLDEYSDGTAVTWDWTQRFDPGTPGYPDVMGFGGSKAALPIGTGEKVTNSWAAPNGKVYCLNSVPIGGGTLSNSFHVVNPDATHSVLTWTDMELTDGTVAIVNLAPGPDGNLYGISYYSGDPAFTHPAHITCPVSSSGTWEIVWKVDATTDALSYTSRASTISGGGLPLGEWSTRVAYSTSTGVIWFISNSSNNFGYLKMDTSTLALTLTSFTDAAILGQTMTWPVVDLGVGNFATVVRESSSTLYRVITFNTSGGTYSAVAPTGDILPISGAYTLFGNSVDGLFAQVGARIYSVDASRVTALLSTDTGSGYTYGVTENGYAIGTRSAGGGTRNGLWITNVITHYLYKIYVTALGGGSYTGLTNTHNVAINTGDYTLIWANTYFNYVKRIPGSLRMFVQSSGGITFLDPVLIAGDPGVAPFPLNTELPWPEIKYVIAQRLTVSGWIDVGTYLGPGTLNDPVPPGTYNYRLIPVSNMGVRGDPTAVQSITIT